MANGQCVPKDKRHTMRRIIPISLLIFWAMQFALQMIAAIKGMPMALFSPFDHDIAVDFGSHAAISVLAVMSGLIAALFTWAAVTVAVGGTMPEDTGEDTVRLAFCSAMAVVTVLCVLSAMQGEFVLFQPVAILMAALAISWSTCSRDLNAADAAAGKTDSQRVASLMAEDAAHKMMLGAISGRNVRI